MDHKHYFKVFLALLNFAIKRALEYRINILGVFTLSLCVLLLMLFVTNIIFLTTSEINGWSKYQVFFFIGLYKLFSSLVSFLFAGSVHAIPQYIKQGDLDIFLTKPISSQFYLSLRRMRFNELFDILPGVLTVLYASKMQEVSYSVSQWLILLIALLIGTIIFYSIYFSIATISIWTASFNSLQSIYGLINQSLSFPIDLLGKRLAFFLTFIIPFGLIISVPAKVFYGKEPLGIILVSSIFAFWLMIFSIWFWNFALKRYTSASS